MKPGLILHTQKGVVLLNYYLLVYFLPCHQVKLLESLESMDKDSFNMKFGGVLTYTTVGADLSIFYKENTDLDSDNYLTQAYWLIGQLTDWLTDQPTQWPTRTYWLTNWLTDWLTNCLTDRQTDWLSNGLTDWISSEQTAWLIDWWSDNLTARPTGGQRDRIFHHLANWSTVSLSKRLNVLTFRISRKWLCCVVSFFHDRF